MTKQLHDGDDSGYILGQAATDKVSFFGSTPVTQQSVTGTLTTGGTTTQTKAVLIALRDALEALGLITSS